MDIAGNSLQWLLSPGDIERAQFGEDPRELTKIGNKIQENVSKMEALEYRWLELQLLFAHAAEKRMLCCAGDSLICMTRIGVWGV